jgi:hypothetical protein
MRRKQAAAIVKVLALTPRRTLHRELLIDQLWPELAVEDPGPHFEHQALEPFAFLVRHHSL